MNYIQFLKGGKYTVIQIKKEITNMEKRKRRKEKKAEKEGREQRVKEVEIQ
jgi:hypothetical protein